MKSLRKSILTLLALTLFGGAGAWAQGPTQVTQFTTDLIASWQDGSSHGNVNPPDQGSVSKGDFYSMIAHGEKCFYTGSPNQAIELTKAGANQWTLGQAPDYDLELQVEYYEAHALKNIPAGWQVMVNGVDKTAAIDHDSLLITETDSVTLVPAGNPRRVKSVTLEDEAPAVQTITIGGITLNITGCITWLDIIDLNPGLIWEFNGFIESNDGMLYNHSGDMVDTFTPYDPSEDYEWMF